MKVEVVEQTLASWYGVIEVPDDVIGQGLQAVRKYVDDHRDGIYFTECDHDDPGSGTLEVYYGG